uniref:Uncharacterized protein n=1 Tax=viral metagenome TaxID=1070528 RepID=A0A6C0CB73_9ZZZZ
MATRNICIGSDFSYIDGYSNVVPYDTKIIDLDQKMDPQIRKLTDKIIERMFHQATEDARLLDQPGQSDKILERMERKLKKDLE